MTPGSRLALLVCFAALAGSIPKADQAAESTTSHSPAASAAHAVRPGHWRLVAGDEFSPAAPVTLCLSGRGFSLGRMAKSCSRGALTPTPQGFALDASCQMRGAKMTVHGVATGDFQTAYKADLNIEVLPGPGATPMHIKNHSEYKYVGPCDPGERADDQ